MMSPNKSLEKNIFSAIFYFGILLYKKLVKTSVAIKAKHGNKIVYGVVKCFPKTKLSTRWSLAEGILTLLQNLRLATPRATLTHLSCSPNLPRASYLNERTLTYEPIVKLYIERLTENNELVNLLPWVCYIYKIHMQNSFLLLSMKLLLFAPFLVNFS